MAIEKSKETNEPSPVQGLTEEDIKRLQEVGINIVTAFKQLKNACIGMAKWLKEIFDKLQNDAPKHYKRHARQSFADRRYSKVQVLQSQVILNKPKNICIRSRL